MNKTPKPTDSELAILQVLWNEGPSTVRAVMERLDGQRAMGYTTALKFLQIMFEKGLVERDESQRSHVYRAVSTEEQTQRQILRDVMDRAFHGSAKRLVLQALAEDQSTPEELAHIHELLEKFEEDRQS